MSNDEFDLIEKYPELDPDMLSGLWCESKHYILKKNYCLIFVTDSNEYNAEGFDTAEEVIARVKEYYEGDDQEYLDDSGWYPDCVIHKGEELSLEIKLTATVIIG